jgi:hypothetical protein
MTAAVERVLAAGELARQLSRGAHDRARACDWSRVLLEWERVLARS